jgi:hypothetical protein
MDRIIAAGDPIPSWPLPTTSVTNNGRPTTSDGVLDSTNPRPDTAKRRNTADNILDRESETTAVAAPVTVDGDELERLKMAREKKKRFGKLRKVFGMKA